MPERVHRVAVFARAGKKKQWILTAYTRWYNLLWTGYVGTYNVEAATGAEAKRIAKQRAQAHLDCGWMKPRRVTPDA